MLRPLASQCWILDNIQHKHDVAGRAQKIQLSCDGPFYTPAVDLTCTSRPGGRRSSSWTSQPQLGAWSAGRGTRRRRNTHTPCSLWLTGPEWRLSAWLEPPSPRCQHTQACSLPGRGGEGRATHWIGFSARLLLLLHLRASSLESNYLSPALAPQSERECEGGRGDDIHGWAERSPPLLVTPRPLPGFGTAMGFSGYGVGPRLWVARCHTT